MEGKGRVLAIWLQKLSETTELPSDSDGSANRQPVGKAVFSFLRRR